jgi:hypothetical protein
MFGTGTFRVVAPGGYSPPEYLSNALDEATRVPTAYKVESRPDNRASLSTLRDSRLTADEAGYIHREAEDEGGWDAAVAGMLGFNPNVWPPVGADATYGTLSDREALGLV